MLHTVKEINGDAIRARDGEIGSVKDVYFDDERWAVRYFVVDTGKWLPGRKVLISPASVAPGGAEAGVLPVDLTREQVKAAPDIAADAPISRKMEEAHARHYGYQGYWAGPLLWGVGPMPVAAPPAPGVLAGAPRAGVMAGDAPRDEISAAAEREAAQSHLRSSNEVTGYAIRATDGEIGHVEDFLIDDATWAIAGMVVDTRNWLPGKKVVVQLGQVEEIDWAAREARLRVKREDVERSPLAY